MNSNKIAFLETLQTNGYNVEPVQDMFRVTKDGKARYLNIRCKQSASYHRRGKRYEFGMSKRDFDRYRRLAEKGGEVYSVMLELDTGNVYIAPVVRLAETARTYEGDNLDATVFVPIASYVEIKGTDPADR